MRDKKITNNYLLKTGRHKRETKKNTINKKH